MPHLTSTTTGTTGTGVRTALGVPGYAHPLVAPAQWAELARPGAPVDWVVLNVAAGPGTRPDPHCLEAAGRLRNAGVRVLGHLDADPGSGPGGRYGGYGSGYTGGRGRGVRGSTLPDLLPDAHRYLDWYQVDGFLIDHCPAERTALPEVRRTVACLRALREDAHIVLGHGTHPHPGFAESAEQLVTFSGPWSAYRWSQVAEWTADYPPDRFCHFVHGVPLGHLDEALRIARWQGAATIYLTDHTDRGGRVDPWETMPGYWDEIVSRIGTGVSE
ncbi:spherulation-specific family 4 protein [Streptomyces sp. NPDC047028]|uniref:spherulation-specific family 4 protein n=1 Tax=Streptomyces sp. NPDC047028 TaxID=3155793 RepID=UPI00340179C9